MGVQKGHGGGRKQWPIFPGNSGSDCMCVCVRQTEQWPREETIRKLFRTCSVTEVFVWVSNFAAVAGGTYGQLCY